MSKLNSGFYGLLFVVLLSVQLTRETNGRSMFELIATSAMSLIIGFIFLLPFCYKGSRKTSQLQSMLISIVLAMGLIITVFDTFKYYNLTSQEPINFIMVALILFAVAFYAGLLNNSAVKTAGLFVSFLLIAVLLTIAMFNLPHASVSNIEPGFNINNVLIIDDLLTVAPLIPAIVVINNNELKVGKLSVLMISVFILVAIFNILAEMVFGNNLMFFDVPTNALAIVGELSIFRRLDIVLAAIFFLTGCMKMSLFSNAIAYQLNQKRYYIIMAITVITCIVLNEISFEVLPIIVGALSIIVSILFLVPYKKIIKLAVLVPIVFLSGCGGTELQERAAVTMTFVDLEDEYKVSLLVCTEYEENGPSVSLISGSGETFSSALYDVAKEVNGELYMGQSELILLGKGFTDKGIGELLPQLYETKMTDGNAFIYLSEYTENDLKENEGALLDATGSILRQSESNRLTQMQIYGISINENGLVDGMIPVVDVFEYKGAVATKGVIYNNGVGVSTVIREQLELIYAINSNRQRIAVVYEYEGNEKVTGVSEIYSEMSYDNDKLDIEVECVPDESLSQEELDIIRISFAKDIEEVILISIESDVDIFSIEQRFNIELSNIKKLNTTVKFKS